MSSGLAIEADRVRCRTAPIINRRIDARTIRSIRHYANQPRFAVERRIRELNEEWDVERTLAVSASGATLAGLVLSVTAGRRWLVLSAGAATLLLVHGLQGPCPPVTLLRRAGLRTRTEIDREKLALKYLRGDFGEPAPRPSPLSAPPRERRRLGALVEEPRRPDDQLPAL